MSFFNRPKEEKIESQYDKLIPPNLESTIPPHLLQNESEGMKYLLEEQSKQSAFASWAIPTLMEISHQTRKTNGRLLVVEKWKDRLNNTYVVLLALGTVAWAIIRFGVEAWGYFHGK